MLKKLLQIALLTTTLFSYEIMIDKTKKKVGFTRNNTKEIVIDNSTGLMWQDDSSIRIVQKDWNGAKEYCQDLDLLDFNDWYLPTKKELETIIDKKREPAIRKEFKNTISYYYWSSTTYASNTSGAWGVSFYDGHQNTYYMTRSYYVRCVRAGQFDTLNFENLISNLIKKELKRIPKPPSELKLQKDEFETTKEFNARVEKTKVKQKKLVTKYKKKYSSLKQKAEKSAIKKALEITWGRPILSNPKYDADNSIFVADVTFENKKDFKKKVAIKVKRKNARAIKNNFNSLKPQAVFEIDTNSVKLKELRVPYKKKLHAVYFTDINLDDTVVAVNLKNDIYIDAGFTSTNITVAQNSVSTFDASNLTNFSELDKLLASSKQVKTDKTKWLFVVGIEQYEFTDNISYAKRSAEMFVKTAQKRLGVPNSNKYVMINSNASGTKIKTNMKKMLRRVKKGDTIYFYYNGHGVPVPSLKNAPYMLTADTEPDFVADEKFFSLQNIYTKLSDSKAKKVVAIVDSCFSGVTDGKSVLKGVAATKMVAKSVSFNKEKMVVMSAGKANQYSNGYNKKGHRLFSFYIMKNILEGDKTIKQLYKDTKTQTYDTSIEEYGDSRTQEPTIDGNFRLSL